MEITRSAVLPAAPDEVAALVADLSRWPEWFALWKGWSGEPPSGPPRVGTQFKHKVRVLGVPGDMSWAVVELDIPHRVRLEGKGPSRTSAKLDVGIEPAGDGGSKIELTCDLGGLVLKPVEGQLRTWLDVRIERTLASLERLLAAS